MRAVAHRMPVSTLLCVLACGLWQPVAGQMTLDNKGYFRNGSALFFPVGVNYWPSSTGCNLWSAATFPAAEIQHDLDVLAASPFNTVRLFVTWGELEPSEAVYDEKKFSHLGDILHWASSRGLAIDVSTFVGWMSGKLYWPKWKGSRNLYTDPTMIARSRAFALKVAMTAARVKHSILALEYGNEMDCCTDKAPPVAVVNWTHTIYAAFNAGCPGALVVPGTDENTVFGDTGWPLGGVTGRIAGDVFDVHPYPVLFTPTKGDGFFDGVTQAGPTYDSSFVRAFGPVFMQEWGTLVTGGSRQQDAYLRRILPETLGNGVNGWLYWCMRDIDGNKSLPYYNTGMETALGLFDHNDKIKKGLEFYADFARNVTRLTVPPPLPENDPNALGLYVPLHYYVSGDSANRFNSPSQQAGHATLAYHLLRSCLRESTRVVRGDQELPAPAALRTLIVTSAFLAASEIAALRAWVESGGQLIWHGLTSAYFSNASSPAGSSADAQALVGAAAATGAVARNTIDVTNASSVEFGGKTWRLAHWLNDLTPPQLRPTTAARVWNATTDPGRVLMTMTNLKRGRVFASVAAIDATTRSLMGKPGPRDAWRCWFEAALACVRTAQCDKRCSDTLAAASDSGSERSSLPSVVPSPGDRNNEGKGAGHRVPQSVTVYGAGAYESSIATAVAGLGRLGVNTSHLSELASMDDITGSTLLVLASMPLPEMDVAFSWLRSDISRCLLWSGFDTKSISRALYSTFGVAAANIRTPVPSVVKAFGRTFELDAFAGSNHITFDAVAPQRPEWGQAATIATDQRQIAVLHKHVLLPGSSSSSGSGSGSGAIAVMASPFVERSKLATAELQAWYGGLLGLCPEPES